MRRYFHSVASSQKNNNSIAGVFDSQGEWRNGSFMEQVFIGFFSSLFTTSYSSDFNEIFAVISNKLETDMIRNLDWDFCAWK